MPTSAPPSSSDSNTWTEPPQLRTLRRMVAVLMATLIIGVLTIAGTLVIRIMMESGPAAVASIGADAVAIPPGEEITAVGATPSALSIATRDAAGTERIRVFHPKTGEALSETTVARR